MNRNLLLLTMIIAILLSFFTEPLLGAQNPKRAPIEWRVSEYGVRQVLLILQLVISIRTPLQNQK